MEANQYLPTVAWRTNIQDVILLTSETVPDPATYRVSVAPLDVNEPGAILAEKEIGYYLKDFVGHTYRVITVGSGTVDISDDFRTGVGPQEGRKGIVYKSVGDGNSPYLAPVYYRGLDKSAIDYSRRFELDILWKASRSVGVGVRQTGVDAGYYGEVSLTDDFEYRCVQEGVAGVAIWKKIVAYQT
jgi:hypothetical protein